MIRVTRFIEEMVMTHKRKKIVNQR